MAKMMDRIKTRTAPVQEQEHRSDTPYAGLLMDDQPAGDGTSLEPNVGRNAGELVISAPHLLVVGKTGSRKTRSCLAPNVVIWGDRPVVAVSSKGDLAELTIRQRAKNGPVFLLDLSGEVRESELQGVDVTRVIADPCALVTNDDEAIAMAGLLLEIGAMSGNSGGGSGGDSAFWATLAKRMFAALVRAGGWFPNPEDPTGPMIWGGGIGWVLDAVEDSGSEVVAKSAKKGTGGSTESDEDEVFDLDSPNWDTAYLRATLLGSRHARSIMSAKKLDPKQRDSISINCRVATAAWVLDSVLGDGSEQPFHPSMLEASGATLFIVSPFSGAAAPAATATIMQCVDHWRKRVGQLDELLMVIDELPNGSPLPLLAQMVGEARGLGIRLCCAMQATSQFEPRWGSAGLKILRDTFPAVLIYPGIGGAEKELLEDAAWSTGEEERSTSSTDHTGKASLSHDRVAARTAAELLPRRHGEARLLLSGGPGLLVRVPDISDTNLRA